MKNKVVSIHQPNYINWLGYFYKIYMCDFFIFFNDVQYSNLGAHNYHYIKTPQGAFRLKIPVRYNHPCPINEVVINPNIDWKKKHLKTVEMNYKKAPFYDEVYEDFKHILSFKTDSLAEFNIYGIKYFTGKFGFDTSFYLSSELNIDSKKEKRIIDICLALDADTYYSGLGAKEYQSEENFKNAGLKLVYSDFTIFEYPQLWGQFVANVSIIDYLMNCGYDWDRVLSGQKNNNNLHNNSNL